MAKPADLDQLRPRDEFSRLALARSGGLRCACKAAPAAEAHHIFDRKLFPDGSISPGPLISDDGRRRALAAAGLLGLAYASR